MFWLVNDCICVNDGIGCCVAIVTNAFWTRKIEAIVVTLILTIYLFSISSSFIKPNLAALFGGLPQLQTVSTHGIHGADSPLVMTLGIIGARLCHHNLYLHSSISQTRQVSRNKEELKEGVRFMAWDSNIQLSLACY